MQVICRCSNSFDKSQSKHNWGGVILFELLKWFEFFKSFCTFCLLCRNQVSGVKFLESEIPSIFLQVPFLQWINIQTGLNCYKILLNFNSWNYKEYYWTPLKSVWQIQGMCIIFGENVYSYKLIFMDKLKMINVHWALRWEDFFQQYSGLSSCFTFLDNSFIFEHKHYSHTYWVELKWIGHFLNNWFQV